MGYESQLQKFPKSTMCGFPKMVVPPQTIHFNGIFQYKPSVLGYPHLWKHPCFRAQTKTPNHGGHGGHLSDQARLPGARHQLGLLSQLPAAMTASIDDDMFDAIVIDI